MSLEVREIKPLIGAEITLAKEDLLDPEIAAECARLLEDRVVIVLPALSLSDDEQLAFTDLLGERIRYTASVRSDVHEDIYQVTLDPALNKTPDYVLGTFFWHMDGITTPIPPPKTTLLSARRISAHGGQTEFANCFAAYEHLSPAEQSELEGLQVQHSVFASVRPALELEVRPQDWDGIKGEMTHPLVWTHPSGRKSLLIGSHAERVIGRPLPEGRALLARLLEWTAQPDFTYRHQWSEGDFVIWNNCGGLHRVLPYDAQSGRMMHRTSIAGTAMVA